MASINDSMKDYALSVLKEHTAREKTTISTYNISNVLDMSSIEDVTKTIAPELHYKKTYISVNRYDSLRESPDSKQITWGATSMKNYQKGMFYLSTDVKKIHGIKLYNLVISDIIAQKLRFAQIPYTILIHELQNDSFTNVDASRRFHFIGRPREVQYQYDYILAPEYTADSVDLDTLIRYNNIEFDKGMDSFDTTEIRMNYNNNGMYWFREPITNTLSELTLSLGFPFQPIAFNPYSFTVLDAVWAGDPDFLYDLTIDGLPSFITSGNYYFNCYVRDFNTDDPVADADIIAYINKKTGFPAIYDYSVPGNIQLFTAGERFQNLANPTITGAITGGTIYLELLDFKAEFEIIYT